MRLAYPLAVALPEKVRHKAYLDQLDEAIIVYPEKMKTSRVTYLDQLVGAVAEGYDRVRALG